MNAPHIKLIEQTHRERENSGERLYGAPRASDLSGSKVPPGHVAKPVNGLAPRYMDTPLSPDDGNAPDDGGILVMTHADLTMFDTPAPTQAVPSGVTDDTHRKRTEPFNIFRDTAIGAMHAARLGRVAK